MSQSLRIAVRADASQVIGFGHVNRCLSLASALGSLGARLRFVSRDLGVGIAHLIQNPSIECVTLPRQKDVIVSDRVPHAAWAEIDWHVDAQQTVEALETWRPDWIVVDEYAFDARWHSWVKEGLGAKICVIDDLADRDLAADLLIDHNFHSDHRAKYSNRIEAGTSILGGPRYALLADAYRSVPPFEVRPNVRSIGIFMGGTDAADLSVKALQACREVVGFEGRIELVVTRAYKSRRALDELALRWPDTTILCDLPNLADFFARHDLQIGAGGGATWERCAVGAPTLMLIAAENQRAVLPALAERDFADVVGQTSCLSVESIGAAISALIHDYERRKKLSDSARKLVDGLGAKRVALRIAASSLSVRPATNADAETMYRWRNDPATRSVSRNSEVIDHDAHLRWLNDSFRNVNRCLLIGYVDGVDVGVIRFDADGETAEVSLYLDPQLHGLGLGGAMLQAGERFAKSRLRGIADFSAIVLEGNHGSIRMFESAGYRPVNGVWRKNAALVAAVK